MREGEGGGGAGGGEEVRDPPPTPCRVEGLVEDGTPEAGGEDVVEVGTAAARPKPRKILKARRTNYGPRREDLLTIEVTSVHFLSFWGK